MNTYFKIIPAILSLFLISCFGFGLIPVSFWYVDEESGNNFVTIENRNNKSSILFGLPLQNLNVNGNDFYTYGITLSNKKDTNNRAVNVCFDSLFLSISKKKIPAKICFWYQSEPIPSTSSNYVKITDTCIYFPSDYQKQLLIKNQPYNGLIFFNVPHSFKSKASIIGSMRIYSDGKLIERKEISINLTKKSYKPFLIMLR